MGVADESIKRYRAEFKDDSSGELSPTEKEFKKRFQAATHRMVHRKSAIDMFRRLQARTFGKCKLATEGENPLLKRQKSTLTAFQSHLVNQQQVGESPKAVRRR